MPAEVLAKVFDPFYTTKPLGQGTGLGLSMIYGFIQQSHGHVVIDSEVGRGTTIRLFLPRHLGVLSRGGPRQRRSRAHGHGRDRAGHRGRPAVRLLVMQVLEELGYRRHRDRRWPPGRADPGVLAPDRPADQRRGLAGLNGRQLAEIARETGPTCRSCS
jgi:hypothetical protein